MNKLLFEMLMHFGEENLVNSLVIFLTCPSVTTSESNRFQNLCEMSSSSREALRMCKFIQNDELSVGFWTHEMDFSMSVTLQQTSELGMVGCGKHSLQPFSFS